MRMMLFSFYPPRFRAFFFENPAPKKKQNCPVHWPIVSQKLLKDFLAVAGREPTKTSMEKSQSNGTGTTGWFVGTKFERCQELVTQLGRNSDVSYAFCPMKVGGMSGTYDSNDEIPPAKIDNL